MSSNTKRVAIIGSGASGLPAIKCCLDEGLQPVCYERSSEIGGLWNFREGVKSDSGCVMKSTVINTSKEMMCYSDFPIAKHYANFMHNSKVLEYFNEYANNFSLYEYIKFKHSVHFIKKAPDFSKTGKWILEVKNTETDDVSTEMFDAVMICTGHHSHPHKPKFEGLEDFQGEVLHTHDYRTTGDRFIDKKVLVLGVGNSGLDIAVEISRVTKQTFLSTRRGTWVTHRVMDRGMPVDIKFNTRIFTLATSVLPRSFSNAFAEATINNKFDHELYGLKPEHRFDQAHISVNDDLPNRIICGSIKVKNDIRSFDKNGVTFEDGSYEEIDTFAMATGYVFGFPFLDKEVIDVKENKIQLYKYMFQPDLENQTLAIIGCVQPTGAIMPISELQCRLAARVFKGVQSLPSREEMWEDIKFKEGSMAHIYVKSQRHTIQVNYVKFCDELAELIGVKPQILTHFLEDPKFGCKLMFGPCTPYHWRLDGPGKWDGAKEAINTVIDRVKYPLQTRKVDYKSKGGNLQFLLTFLAFIVIINCLYMAYV